MSGFFCVFYQNQVELSMALCYTFTKVKGRKQNEIRWKEKMGMLLKRITNSSDPMYQEALKLYQISFPYHEQREKISQEEILNDREYHFSLIYDEDKFVGLILYWKNESFLYIEHFCILPEMRNKQYGQKTLNLLKEQNKTLMLEIDPPKDDISKRRKGFYERSGFTEKSRESFSGCV